MEIGITGANGFLGKHLTPFVEKEHQCEKFNRRTSDLFDTKSMRQFVESKDIIIHLAGSNRGSNEELIKVNAIGTMNLLEAIQKYSENDTKIIYASSLQIYGFTDKLVYLNEENRFKPNNIYGISKKTAEEIINYYSVQYDIKAIIFRMSNLYGPDCRPYYNSVISTFIDLIKKNKKITVNGDGEQCRDFIYVSDVVNAFLTLLKRDFKSNTFNICSGTPTTINEIINLLRNVTKIPINVQYKETCDQRNYLIGDPSKSKEQLNYHAKISLKSGLIKTAKACGVLNDENNIKNS